jgi:hypothetical protein
MRHILVLACASLSFGLLASPLAAQDTQLAEHSTPPPPLPPNPSAKPSSRWVDVGGAHTSRARAKASPARHAASVKRDSKVQASSKSRLSKQDRTSHKTGKSKALASKTSASRRQARADKPVHFSAKTIRSCHAMTYRQIMRTSSCRTMISQELAAPAPKASSKHSGAKHSGAKHSGAKRQASAHHKAAVQAKTARNHSTAKRRGR